MHAWIPAIAIDKIGIETLFSESVSKAAQRSHKVIGLGEILCLGTGELLFQEDLATFVQAISHLGQEKVEGLVIEVLGYAADNNNIIFLRNLI